MYNIFTLNISYSAHLTNPMLGFRASQLMFETNMKRFKYIQKLSRSLLYNKTCLVSFWDCPVSVFPCGFFLYYCFINSTHFVTLHINEKQRGLSRKSPKINLKYLIRHFNTKQIFSEIANHYA